jgi:major membrane immunogen (membrane-anchored lipoprotein)
MRSTINNIIQHRNGDADEKTRDKRKHNNTPETSLLVYADDIVLVQELNRP